MFRKLLLLVFVLSLGACAATHETYDTAQFRDEGMKVGKIVPIEGGLSEKQVEFIASTNPPSIFPVDVSILIVGDRLDTRVENLLIGNSIKGLKKSKNISRIVPIPKFLVPETLSFASIQELGVRALSEYIIVLSLDSRDYFNWTRIVDSQYEIISDIEFIVVDTSTSAIVLSDKLHSNNIYRTNLFKSEERKKAELEVFGEQGTLLGNKISRLLSKGD